jgi:hypothetical protein
MADGRDMPVATFACPDPTTFTRPYDLGLEVIGQRLERDCAVPRRPCRRSRSAPRRGHPAAQRKAAPRRPGRRSRACPSETSSRSATGETRTRARHRGRSRRGFLTTILTTIAPCSGWSATVRRRSVCRLTCAEGLQRTTAHPRPTSGGQGVAGSNPVSSTVRPQVRKLFQRDRNGPDGFPGGLTPINPCLCKGAHAQARDRGRSPRRRAVRLITDRPPCEGATWRPCQRRCGEGRR